MMDQAELPTPAAHPAKNQLHADLDFDAYAKADGINATGLKEVLKSPAHFKVYKNQQSKPETEAMRFGKLAHVAILEPRRFRFSAVTQPSFNLRTNVGREDLAKWRADQAPHAIVMTEADEPRIKGMLASVEGHPMLCKLLADGKREVSVFWDDPATKLLCKGRLDFVSARGVAVDLKTTTDARPEPFARDVVQNMYHLQMAHYLGCASSTGLYDDSKYAFIAVEKSPPYAIAIYSAGPSALGVGKQWRDYAMEIYAKAMKTNTWPGLPQKALELELPHWTPVPPMDEP